MTVISCHDANLRGEVTVRPTTSHAHRARPPMLGARAERPRFLAFLFIKHQSDSCIHFIDQNSLLSIKMDITEIANKLIEQTGPSGLNITQQLVKSIQDDRLKIFDIVKGLDSVLTNGSHEIRLKGVELLIDVITSLPNGTLNQKEIEVLTEFVCLRLIDHKTMEPKSLKCLSYFLECNNKPAQYNKKLLDFIKTKASVKRMDIQSRHQVYEIVQKIIHHRRQVTNTVDSDMIYSLVHIIEGENNPSNLILCFAIVQFILKNFVDLEPYIDDIFDWLSSYYPIDYTPTETSEPVAIQRSDLVKALYDCFYASSLLSESLQTLLLEKIESNLMSTRIESLNCLIRCYQEFPLTTIKSYTSTLWTSIRMTCLKKSELVDSSYLETCLRTLTALSKKLSEDGDVYFTFVSDMYEELSIAIRKPEIELSEPALKLLTHAVLPNIVGFNYILDKILPVTLNALSADELRPLPGLAYLFEKLHEHHPCATLKSDLDQHLANLALKIMDSVATNEDALRLANSLICLKVKLDKNTLDDMVAKLWNNYNSSLDIEGCLASICQNFNRMDIVYGQLPGEALTRDAHLNMIDRFDLNSLAMQLDGVQEPCSRSKFSLYLRLLVIDMDRCSRDDVNSIDQTILKVFLVRLREIAMKLESPKLTDKIAQLHAIVMNKLNSDLLNPILMEYFSSSYCQKLIPTSDEEQRIVKNVYLPVLQWIFKSLVVRNHPLASPIINLVLNFTTSEKVSREIALPGAELFQIVISDDVKNIFNPDRDYQKFMLYKQKFYIQTSKEIKIRYEKQSDNIKKDLLLCSLALQVPLLPRSVYKKDIDWLVRELLRNLSLFDVNVVPDEHVTSDSRGEDLLYMIYGCAETLIHDVEMSSFLTSFVDICLKHARGAKTLLVRVKALSCLGNIAKSVKDTDLLPVRAKVVDELRLCLSDKKRLVRQAAAEARLKWTVVGQPIGS